MWVGLVTSSLLISHELSLQLEGGRRAVCTALSGAVLKPPLCCAVQSVLPPELSRSIDPTMAPWLPLSPTGGEGRRGGLYSPASTLYLIHFKDLKGEFS
jgi:hypothetical protein